MDEDVIKLQGEQNDIAREQARGEWKKWEELTEEVKSRFTTPEAHDSWVQSRIHRGIEITMILRRSNTGPAKPGGKRGGKKPPLDFDALNADVLA